MRRMLILAAAPLIALADTASCDNAGPQSAEEQYVQDSKVTENVLSAANDYVTKQVEAVGYLVVKDASANTERRFAVV